MLYVTSYERLDPIRQIAERSLAEPKAKRQQAGIIDPAKVTRSARSSEAGDERRLRRGPSFS
jgi:hypothetical protein